MNSSADLLFALVVLRQLIAQLGRRTARLGRRLRRGRDNCRLGLFVGRLTVAPALAIAVAAAVGRRGQGQRSLEAERLLLALGSVRIWVFSLNSCEDLGHIDVV